MESLNTRSLDSFPERIRRMSKEQLEAAIYESTDRRESYDAAAWLAKTGELGGPGSRLGCDLREALELLEQSLPHAEYQAVISILLQLSSPPPPCAYSCGESER
jgi:hypothetical protein